MLDRERDEDVDNWTLDKRKEERRGVRRKRVGGWVVGVLDGC